MFGFLSASKAPSPEIINKRRFPRFTTKVISCSLGEVVDLSAGGVRLRGKGKAPVCRGQIIPMTLFAHESQVTIKARAVHIRRVGLRTWEAGFAFVDIRPQLAIDIDNLGKTGEIPRWTYVAPKVVRAEASLPDYYKTLGVKQAAKWEQIRVSFHQLAKKYHPDANPDPSATARFQQLIEAYKVLKDPDKRKQYDILYADRDQNPMQVKQPLPVNERRKAS
jgi:hypothetical protein